MFSGIGAIFRTGPDNHPESRRQSAHSDAPFTPPLSNMPSFPPRSQTSTPFEPAQLGTPNGYLGGYNDIAMPSAEGHHDEDAVYLTSHSASVAAFAGQPTPSSATKLFDTGNRYSAAAVPPSPRASRTSQGSYPFPKANGLTYAMTAYPSLEQTFNRLINLLSPVYPELVETLSGPCLPAQLHQLEKLLAPAYTLPRDVRQAFRFHDGQDEYSIFSGGGGTGRGGIASASGMGLIFGLWVMTAEEVLEEWSFWRHFEARQAQGQTVVDDPFAPAVPTALHQAMGSCPAHWVHEVYSHPSWLPLLKDGYGNYIGVDLDPPAPPPLSLEDTGEATAQANDTTSGWHSLAGQPGQVIAFGRDIDLKTVIFPGWGPDGGWARFLSSVADDLESGDFATVGHDGRDGAGDGGHSDGGSDDGEDGLGDVAYLDEGVEDYAPNFSEGRRGHQQSHRLGGDGWQLRAPYRGMGVVEALCERSRRRWQEVGLYPSIRSELPPVPPQLPSAGLSIAVSAPSSAVDDRSTSPNLIGGIDSNRSSLESRHSHDQAASEQHPLASTSATKMDPPTTPRRSSVAVTLSPPSPKHRGRFQSPKSSGDDPSHRNHSLEPAPRSSAARRRPPPPAPMPIFLPTMADLVSDAWVTDDDGSNLPSARNGDHIDGLDEVSLAPPLAHGLRIGEDHDLADGVGDEIEVVVPPRKHFDDDRSPIGSGHVSPRGAGSMSPRLGAPSVDSTPRAGKATSSVLLPPPRTSSSRRSGSNASDDDDAFDDALTSPPSELVG